MIFSWSSCLTSQLIHDVVEDLLRACNLLLQADDLVSDHRVDSFDAVVHFTGRLVQQIQLAYVLLQLLALSLCFLGLGCLGHLLDLKLTLLVV